MKLVRQARLLFVEGKWEKVYEVDLCEVGPNKLVVNFRYGKKGAALKDGSKTVAPVYEITDTIQVMIDLGLVVRTANSVLNDVNVTMPADLVHCNLLDLRKYPNELLIGEGTQVYSGAKLERCVLGSNVTIRHPIHLRDTVVFDDTIVEAETDFERFIIMPDAVLDCGYNRAGVSRAR